MKEPALQKKLIASAIALAVLVVSGCASNAPVEGKQLTLDEQAKIEASNALAQISQSTVSAINAQSELALSADAKLRRESNYRKRFLTQKVDYDFYGDVEQILQDVSNNYNYTFKKVGNRPVGGVLVNVFSKNISGVDLLKSVAHSDPGQRIDVRLTDAEIILYYKEAANTSLKRLSQQE